MKEVNREEIFKLRGIFTQIIKEMNGRLSADEAIVKFDRAYQGEYLKIFTDDIDNPKHCLILAVYPGMVDSGFICVNIMRYSDPDHRSPSANNIMEATAAAFGKKYHCEGMLGSSWVYKGSMDTSAAWLSQGYKPQEHVFYKAL
jgi:hypothetical protein